MCAYSRNPTSPPAGTCTGAQDAAFSAGSFGFDPNYYWSSSQINRFNAGEVFLDSGVAGNVPKSFVNRVRPVRVF